MIGSSLEVDIYLFKLLSNTVHCRKRFIDRVLEPCHIHSQFRHLFFTGPFLISRLTSQLIVFLKTLQKCGLQIFGSSIAICLRYFHYSGFVAVIAVFQYDSCSDKFCYQ